MGSGRTVGRVLLLLALGNTVAAFAQFGSLKTVTVPAVPGLERYVRDRQALLVLGKSLFWDMQVGSDGHTACATCHFHAGADHRSQNQLSNPNGAFEPNHLMSLDDFPFRVFADSNNNLSSLRRDSSQRTGSAGICRRTFLGLTGAGFEEGIDSLDAPAFRVGGRNTRQVTPRNAPSVINAALNVRNFLDGRASDVFTGRTPFGDSDPRPNVLVVSNGQLAPEPLRLTNSSLASQAVSPPVNPVEMSYVGRTWPIIGRKLLPARPLANQKVAADDSVLGAYANPRGRGLDPTHTYFSLIQAAFQPAYWDSEQLVDENGFTQAESNFSLFFGLAIQAYESTLIAEPARSARSVTRVRN
jgi:cytochrome c peroxidase